MISKTNTTNFSRLFIEDRTISANSFSDEAVKNYLIPKSEGKEADDFSKMESAINKQ